MGRLDGYGPLLDVVIGASSSGNNTLKAAAGAGLKIAVCQGMLFSTGTVTAIFQDGAGGSTLLSIPLIANSGAVIPTNEENGWFITSANTLLNLNLSGAVAVSGILGVRVGSR